MESVSAAATSEISHFMRRIVAAHARESRAANP